MTAYEAEQVVRGETETETLAGTIYNYGTGTGYNINLTLEHLTESTLQSILDQIAGAGTTFYATFFGGGGTQTDRLCKADSIKYNLQVIAETVYWSLSFTLVTVD